MVSASKSGGSARVSRTVAEEAAKSPVSEACEGEDEGEIDEGNGEEKWGILPSEEIHRSSFENPTGHSPISRKKDLIAKHARK